MRLAEFQGDRPAPACYGAALRRPESHRIQERQKRLDGERDGIAKFPLRLGLGSTSESVTTLERKSIVPDYWTSLNPPRGKELELRRHYRIELQAFTSYVYSSLPPTLPQPVTLGTVVILLHLLVARCSQVSAEFRLFALRGPVAADRTNWGGEDWLSAS